MAIVNDDDEFGNRDRPLSFHWKAQDETWSTHLDLPPTSSKRYAQARASILLEAYLVGRAEPERYISYSRHKKFYSNLMRYHGTAYTYANVVSAVDQFADMGLLENHKTPPGQRGRQSIFRATPDLLALFDQPVPVLYGPCETIRVRDANGNLADYRDTVRTDRMRKHLAVINEPMTAAKIDLAAPGIVQDEHTIRCGEHVLYPAMRTLYRVFNRGRFSLGGRLYGGWWQQARKTDREFLTIDGDPTVELDYPCLHPSMLYAMAGKALTSDPYVIDGWGRKLAKVAFNILVNARTPRQALAAIAERIGGEGCFEKARRLIEAIEAKHAPIADAFGSDAGLRLQRTDSDMAEHIVLTLVRKGVLALPIHDSFIVRMQDKEELMEAMAAALERFVFVANSPDFSISYDDSVPHMGVSLPFPCPVPLLVLPPENPNQLDFFGRPSISIPFNEVHGFRSGVAPAGVRKAARHELRRRNIRQDDLANRIGISRSQLTNILDGRFGAGPKAARGIRGFILEGAETVGLVKT